MLDYNYGDHLPVLDHGHVALLDVMGTDADIVAAARISYDGKGRSEDRALIRYLLRHRHTSPFEMAELKFELKMPIFVARQWVRHRTASMNEVSARYTEVPEEMFVPESLPLQSSDNKQGRNSEVLTGQEVFLSNIRYSHHKAYEQYEMMTTCGVTRELARGVLPLNTYTKFIWKIDLHNLMHFLKLRLDPHAQQEIREYAEQIEKLVALKFPLTYEAFVDYQRDAYTCSRMEMELIREYLWSYADSWNNSLDIEAIAEPLGMSKREIAEFKRRFFDVEQQSS